MGKVIIRIMALLGLFSFPIAFRKKPIKDWLIVYLITALSSILLDIILVEKKLLSYPIRIFPKYFKFHIVFDLLLCPIVSVFYNQLTYKDKSMTRIVGKLLLFTIPQLLIEVLTGRYLNMVKWHKWWRWYHTFISMNVKYLVIRMFVQLVRMISKDMEKLEQN